MRKIFAIILLLALMAGGMAWLAWQDIPPPQMRVEQELDYEAYITE